MTDQAKKLDAGKARFDLLPWADFPVSTTTEFPVAEVFEALKIWWTGRPHKLVISVPRRQLPGIAAVLGFGAAKYADRGWEAGIPFSRIFAAAARHATADAAGELLDPESGLPHASHFWCNVVFLLAFTERGQSAELDDRPAASASTRVSLDRLNALVSQLEGHTGVSSAGLADAKTGKGSN